MQKRPKFGVKPNPKDRRDFKVGKSYELPDIASLPDEFKIEPLFGIKDQANSDFCSAFAACYMSEVQEEVELNPEWHFMVSKVLSGDPEEWGQWPRYAMKVSVKKGDIKDSISPYDVKEDDYNKIRYEKEWPDLYDKAEKHKKQSYFEVDGPYDHFDNIRATIHKFKSPVSFNLDFGYDLSEKFFDEPKGGSGHMMTIVGWTPDYAIALNQYGEDAGDEGYHYISREVINKNVEKYGGVYILIDRDPEEVKKEQWSLWDKLINFLIKWLKQ